MPKHHRVLCPVDLSENSLEAIEMATMFAKHRDAKIDFTYVTPLWFPEESKLKAPFITQQIEEHKSKLFEIRPTDDSIEFEHHYLEGNAGPTLVQASQNADVVVMSTHGRSGIARLLMGSVANYVLRNAKCPVVLVKGDEVEAETPTDSRQERMFPTYVTEVMHSVAPVNSFESMDDVLESLTKARETAAPVVDGSGRCIGILTTTDIKKFRSLRQRLADQDESVIDEVLETDDFGQRRTSGSLFDQVGRHMTKDVISVRNNDSMQKAIELLNSNPTIHHLVVLDQEDRPVGIIDQLNVAGVRAAERQNTAR
jgi:nucleotide-binding universal stress UspA family protein/CBS domain-containing protein